MRVGDKGIAADGSHKPNYEPGPDLLAKVVVLGEGPRGTLAKTAIAKLGLDRDRDPQVYAVGIKELWQVPAGRLAPGHVIHTLGAPLPADTFGGGWIYGMNGDIVDIGLVTGLDYADPTTDPHNLFQQMKLLPAIRPLLEGGTLIRYGAKAIPEGGLHAMPRFYADGLCLIGDTRRFSQRAAAQGHPSRDQIGDARGRGDLRSARAGAQRRRARSAAYEQKFRDVVGVHRTARGAQLPRRLQERAVRRHAQRRARHADRRPRLRLARQALGRRRLRADAQARRVRAAARERRA